MVNKKLKKRIMSIVMTASTVMTLIAPGYVQAEEPETAPAVQSEQEETKTAETQAPETQPTEAPAPPQTEAPAPPQTEAPAPPETEAPVPPQTEAPAPPETETPAPPQTEAPATEAPETEAPETEAPATEKPGKDASGTETPDTKESDAETEQEKKKDETEKDKDDNKKKEEATADVALSNNSSSMISIDIYSYPSVNKTEATIEIYQYLRNEMGLNHAGACGVLANIHLESNFNPVAVGDGGTSLGLCQWHLGRCTNLINYCTSAGVDYRSIEGQMKYLQHELETSYPHVLEYVRSVPDTAQGAYDAASYWCTYFEIPSETAARAAQRGNLAKSEYFPQTFEKEEAKTAKVKKSADEATTTSRLNVREKAGSENKKVTVLDKGAEVKILSEEGDWYQISYGDNQTGYVSAKYLEKAEAEEVTDPVTKPDTEFLTSVMNEAEPNALLVANEKSVENEETADTEETNAPEQETKSDSENNTEAEASSTKQKTVKVKARLNLREEANAQAKYLGTFPVDSELEVSGEEGNWYKVSGTIDGKNVSGFVSKNFVTEN